MGPIPLLIFIAAFFFSDPPSQQVQSFPVAGSRSLLTSPPKIFFREIDRLILVYPNGTAHFVDRKTSDSLWSVSLGGNLTENRTYNHENYMFLGEDLSLYEFTSGKVPRKLGLTIEELILQLTKGNGPMDVVVSVNISVKYFDEITGRELFEHTSSGLLDVGQGLESGLVTMKRIDYSLSSSSSLEKPLWSLKTARVIAHIDKYEHKLPFDTDDDTVSRRSIPVRYMSMNRGQTAKAVATMKKAFLSLLRHLVPLTEKAYRTLLMIYHNTG